MRDERSLDEKLAPREFIADVRWAARAVFSQPRVALVSLALWCIPVDSASVKHWGPAIALAAVASFVCMFGWLGAERLFFLRRREGKRVTLMDLLDSVPRFTGRFLRLSVLAGMVLIPLLFVVQICAGRVGPTSRGGTHGVARVVLVLIALTFDFLFTFVPSALVFSTRSAREALAIGVRLIRQTWPRSGLYVLCPPLAVNMLIAMYPTQLPLVRLVSTALGVLLALVAKGATVAFYLREQPVMPEVVGTPPEAPVQAQ